MDNYTYLWFKYLSSKLDAILAKLNGEQQKIATAMSDLEKHTAALDAAVQSQTQLTRSVSMSSPSGNPTIDSLVTDVTNATGVMASATVLINGFATKLKAAVDQALAGGATAAQLSGLTALQADLEAKASDLSAAVAANP